MDIRGLKALNIFVAINSIRKRFIATAFAKWKMLVQLLALASNASTENIKMQLLEFKYRFKVSSQRVRSLEKEIIELSKDFDYYPKYTLGLLSITVLSRCIFVFSHNVTVYIFLFIYYIKNNVF